MFGIAKNIRSEVRECTPDLLNQAFDSVQVAQTCAEIEDALEAHRRGELTKEEYETKKAELKKQLPVATFHAMFKNGKRKNEDAIPSGMSIYDLDHIANPRAKWAEIEARVGHLVGTYLAQLGRPPIGVPHATRHVAGRSSGVDGTAIGRYTIRFVCEGLCALLVHSAEGLCVVVG